MVDPGLRGRVALVAGANQGIGAAAARGLAAEGAHVFLTYLRVDKAGHGDPALPQAYDEARARSAEAVVEAIRHAGGRADAWEADLADPAVLPELFDRSEAAFGPAEILVNNAAFWHGDTFLPDRAERFGWRLMSCLAGNLRPALRGEQPRARSELGPYHLVNHGRRARASRVWKAAISSLRRLLRKTNASMDLQLFMAHTVVGSD